MAMAISIAIMWSFWFWKTRTSLSPHFQNLFTSNANYSDQEFHADNHLTTEQSTALLASLRKQMPKHARAIPLRPENDLYDALQLDPISLELDMMVDLCRELQLQYEIDEQKPLWEHVITVKDLTTYIANLKPSA
jgi:hypothetical protein